jgi:hypothetical protein
MVDQLQNRANRPVRSGNPEASLANDRGGYRMPRFEDQTAYTANAPGNSGHTYSVISAGLQDRGIDPQTWNDLPTDVQWQVVDEILNPSPSPEAAPEASPAPFRPRRFMIDPNRGL